MSNPLPQQIVVIANLAAFQSTNAASYGNGGAQIAYLQGTVTELDGGQGFYQRIDNDFSTPSNPPSVIVDGGGNRWSYANVSLTAAAIIALLTGTPLPIVAGGTGQATAQLALDALTVQGANIAAAATTNLATATGEFVVVTGNGGPITALGTATAGIWRFVRFTGTPTLTHNGTSLILPGAANITVAAGDTAMFMSLGSGNWQCLFYTEIAGGTVGTLPVSQGGTGLTSGTSGGVLGFTASGVAASSVALTANALVLGGGAGATPTPLASLGTTTTVLHGNAAGAPTFGAVDLAADVTGTLGAANGGTGNATYAVGDLLYASGATALSRLADVATGSVLVSGGVGVAPAWSATPSVTSINVGGGGAISMLAAGTYTPTLTNVANTGSLSVFGVFQYMRVGNVVTVSGAISATPTAPATDSQVGISLPVASNFANFNECAGIGTAASGAIVQQGGIFADTTNDRASWRFVSTTTSASTTMISFTYLVV